jgi:1-acyl-sn-glycerol-3-phosphate acyltransferase
MLRHPIRVLWRLCAFLAVFVAACLDFVFRLWLTGRSGQPGRRTDWCHRWSKQFAAAVALEVVVEGSPPAAGILVSNHLSYLDIVAFATTRPLVFVSKADVRAWPLIGTLTRCAGTLFLKREVKADVVRIGEQFAPLIQAGQIITLFPEGTSSDGQTVLPFKPSLFAPPAEHGWPVTPAAIHYELEDGSVADEVCYWRDMTFFPHFLNLLSKRRIRARVRFGTALKIEGDRKKLAKEAQEVVVMLHDKQKLPAPTSKLQ